MSRISFAALRHQEHLVAGAEQSGNLALHDDARLFYRRLAFALVPNNHGHAVLADLGPPVRCRLDNEPGLLEQIDAIGEGWNLGDVGGGRTYLQYRDGKLRTTDSPCCYH